MKPEDIPAELVEKAARAAHDHIEEPYGAIPWADKPDRYKTSMTGPMAAALAAVLPDIQAQALREAADYQGPADEAAHFTPEARNLLRSLADRIYEMEE